MLVQAAICWSIHATVLVGFISLVGPGGEYWNWCCAFVRARDSSEMACKNVIILYMNIKYDLGMMHVFSNFSISSKVAIGSHFIEYIFFHSIRKLLKIVVPRSNESQGKQNRVVLHPRSPVKPLISEVISKFLLQHRGKPIVLKQPKVQLTRMVVYLFQ